MFTLANRNTGSPRAAQRGFSLIEVMIGAAIALIGMVVIFQVLAVWEERKRSTSAGSDAQVAGAIALYNLGRDLKAGGFGFGRSAAMGCNIGSWDQTLGAAVQGPGGTQFRLYPVEIVNGAGGAPDDVRVLYGNSDSFTANQNFDLTATPVSKRIAATGSRVGFRIGDKVIVTGNTPVNCDLVEITALPIAPFAAPYTSPPYTAQDIVHQSSATSRYSNPAVTGTTSAYVAGVLNNLGPAPRWNVWQIRSLPGVTGPRVLAWSDFLFTPDTWTEVAEGIVDLQAEYGYDDDGNNIIDCDNPALPAPACEWTATLAAPPLTAPINWTRVRALRVALLARSQQYEKDAVYTPAGCTGSACKPDAPAWAGGAFVMRDVDGVGDSQTDDTNDWRHYRYRVYQQVVPLRNVIFD